MAGDKKGKKSITLAELIAVQFAAMQKAERDKLVVAVSETVLTILRQEMKEEFQKLHGDLNDSMRVPIDDEPALDISVEELMEILNTPKGNRAVEDNDMDFNTPEKVMSLKRGPSPGSINNRPKVNPKEEDGQAEEEAKDEESPPLATTFQDLPYYPPTPPAKTK